MPRRRKVRQPSTPAASPVRLTRSDIVKVHEWFKKQAEFFAQNYRTQPEVIQMCLDDIGVKITREHVREFMSGAEIVMAARPAGYGRAPGGPDRPSRARIPLLQEADRDLYARLAAITAHLGIVLVAQSAGAYTTAVLVSEPEVEAAAAEEPPVDEFARP